MSDDNLKCIEDELAKRGSTFTVEHWQPLMLYEFVITKGPPRTDMISASLRVTEQMIRNVRVPDYIVGELERVYNAYSQA